MVPFFLIKDMDVRSSVGWGLTRYRRLFGFLRSDVLMLSANVGGSRRGWLDWRRLVGRWQRLETCDWSVSGETAERSPGLGSSHECAHLTINYKEQDVRKIWMKQLPCGITKCCWNESWTNYFPFTVDRDVWCYSRAKFHNNSISSAWWPYILSWRPTLGLPGSADKTRHETDKARWNYSTHLASPCGLPNILCSLPLPSGCYWICTEIGWNKD